VRAVALHPDAILITSALLQVNCMLVRGGVKGAGGQVVGGPWEDGPITVVQVSGAGVSPAGMGESFVIDSPVLPDELDALPALIEQAGFPEPSGLLATHGDWDHLLARLAFPGLSLGVAESTAQRLSSEPGAAQRELRDFDDELYIERLRPLSLGSVQALPVPGRCELGDRELELHATGGHTADGMAVWIPWARVLVVGDYLSEIEIPMLSPGGDAEVYAATLRRLGPLVEAAEHVVPGHGPVLDSARALAVLGEDLGYLSALAERGAGAEPPQGRRSGEQKRIHERNVAALEA
jgi:glyoxylase-like metal-dependent hydrolase (beta-lactamase superfamily II)